MTKSKAERDAYVEQNLGLVHLCVKRFKGRGIEYDDLYSAGCVGLIKAIDAFDESRGVQLSTYAVPVILGEIKRLFRDGGAIKVSRSLKELSLKVVREKENFTKIHSREPQLSELSEILGAPEEDIVEALNVSSPPVSLTEDDDSGEGRQLDVRVENHEERISELLSLKEVVNHLETRDRRLIMLRYLRGKTQTETAKELGMTQVQVSRREKKILTMLREKLLE
ncbi:Stage II sporulation protein AC [uncultured Ruminococcus sp.]|uniref:Sigma-70 family RNA polymerase sigma factor n=1 Tax=Massiliimalia timonensis TaxID=1987501 RepID=A0A8J6TX19_9FIRM|nr:sigma-70 family RNA polymerase sigma factor [Massiliimalia timonensis]MBC8610510.1 sigma-70 family RNA polymerase sigma factor [Massiliimalia timonensis]MBS7176011.1 sigma-70 family RNA polymerase sigma factor [Clostridiales bacterium]SCH87818.1 Stage II sporulation protein AC [uncultured Clostridium sp.]SCI20454.1 Stage II sporulation protein AC [uncultured Ruminococcus sp.]